MTDWLEIVVPTAVASCEDVGSLLADELADARRGTQLRSGEVVFWVEFPDGERVLAETRAFVTKLAERGIAVDPSAVRAQPAVPEEEWRDAWKKYFHVTRLTRQIVVVPSWESHEPESDDLPVHLDPGQAFGTGAHATTRLVLEELQRLADNGETFSSVLDVGAGSGILSIAALLFWPGSNAAAIDIDPIAIGAIAENAERNGLSERIAASTTPVGQVGGEFDLVLANIQADVLLALRAEIAEHVAKGAPLILAGLLRNQAQHVADTYARESGLSIVGVRPSDHDPEWSVAVLRRD
jgi:ribosomal protein L11 methyltransferase